MILKAPDEGCQEVGFAGQIYPVKNGLVDVPEDAVELFNHGYVMVAPSATPFISTDPSPADAPANKKGKKG